MAERGTSLAARLAIGAAAGIVGTMAMTAAMRRMHRRLPPVERYPLPPREIIDAAASYAGVPAKDLTLAAHFAYGAGCGALLAAANERPGRASGALAGAGIWLASYMGWIPALGLLKPATRHPGSRNLLMIVSHVVWGWATAEAIRELNSARSTIFAAGPARDRPTGSSGD